MRATHRDDLSVAIGTDADVPALAALKQHVAADLTSKHGTGHWSSAATEKGLRRAVTTNRVLTARISNGIIGMLSLQTRKPWAIDLRYFTVVDRPLYLVDMAVDPVVQSQGIGRCLVQEAVRVAQQWPAHAIRLDAYDSPAGAGGFYARCGFTEVGRSIYRAVPLIYFERLL